MNKLYFQLLIKELAKELLKEKNKLAQILENKVHKNKEHSIGYNTNDLDIIITFKEKSGRK